MRLISVQAVRCLVSPQHRPGDTARMGSVKNNNNNSQDALGTVSSTGDGRHHPDEHINIRKLGFAAIVKNQDAGLRFTVQNQDLVLD